MDMKRLFIVLWTVYFVFSFSFCCVRVGTHLDCRTFYEIRGLTRNIDTVVIDDSLSPWEIIHYRHILRQIRVIVWGQQNCFAVCQVDTTLWIHRCDCQVCVSNQKRDYMLL